MKHIALLLVLAVLLMVGCSRADVKISEEYKAELTQKYPPYDFITNPLVNMRYPSFDEMISRAEGDVSFIITDEIAAMEPVTFTYQNTEDQAVGAIDGKLEAQGIAPNSDVTIYPYLIDVKEVSGDGDTGGKIVFFLSQYAGKAPEINSTTGMLVSSDNYVPEIWIEQYEKKYPSEAAASYVCLLHSELAFFYVTDGSEIVPMSDRSKEDYDRFVGMKLSDFLKVID